MSADLYPIRLSQYLLFKRAAPTEQAATDLIQSGVVKVSTPSTTTTSTTSSSSTCAATTITAAQHLIYPATDTVEIHNTSPHITLSGPSPAPTPRVWFIDKPRACVCDMTIPNPITLACQSLETTSAAPNVSPIGQLDIQTTGLLLLTASPNIQRLVNLPHTLPKTYRVSFDAAASSNGLTDEEIAEAKARVEDERKILKEAHNAPGVIEKIEAAIAVLEGNIENIDERLMEAGADVSKAQEIQVERDAKASKMQLYYDEWERLEEVLSRAEEIKAASEETVNA